MADGWGQRGTTDVGATLPYLVRRHTGDEAHNFITLYSAGEDDKFILSAISHQSRDGNLVAVQITMSDGLTDIVLYRFGKGASIVDTAYGAITFDGTAAWVKNVNNPAVVLYGGGSLIAFGKTWSGMEKTSGDIIRYDEHGLYLTVPFQEAAPWVGRTIYIESANKRTGYPVIDVTREGNLTKITTWNPEGEGFAFTGGTRWHMEDIRIFDE